MVVAVGAVVLVVDVVTADLSSAAQSVRRPWPADEACVWRRKRHPPTTEREASRLFRVRQKSNRCIGRHAPTAKQLTPCTASPLELQTNGTTGRRTPSPSITLCLPFPRAHDAIAHCASTTSSFLLPCIVLVPSVPPLPCCPTLSFLLAYASTFISAERRAANACRPLARIRRHHLFSARFPGRPLARTHGTPNRHRHESARPRLVGFFSFVFLRFWWRGWTMLLTWFPLLSRSCCAVCVVLVPPELHPFWSFVTVTGF